MEELLQILSETQIPFAYHHFAEGESPEPPFICYLLPGSNNFSADGKVSYRTVHLFKRFGGGTAVGGCVR